MCRNIETLHKLRTTRHGRRDPGISLQFVRKLCGFTRPAKANQLAFDRAADQVAKAAHELFDSLVTNAPPRDREIAAKKVAARAAVSGSRRQT